MALVTLKRFNGNKAGEVYDIDLLVNEKGVAYIEDYGNHYMVHLLCGNAIRIENLKAFSPQSISGIMRYEKKNASEYKDVHVFPDNITAIMPAHGSGYDIGFTGNRAHVTVKTLDPL